MVEVTVERLGLDSSTQSFVVVLRERGGDGFLPIWIGPAEASAIAMRLKGISIERPLTHDLFRILLESLDARLRRVNISRIISSTYFAEMIIESPSGLIELDARPSDSIAIALRCGAPVFVDDSLLITLDSETDNERDNEPDNEPDAEDSGPDFPGSPAMNADELKRYLETLRPEDFGRFNL